MEQLIQKKFRNKFAEHFEGDQSGDLSPRITPNVFYSRSVPSPVPEPKLLAWSKELAEDLQIKKPGKEDLSILAGNKITPSMQPYAMCYGGHQFGNWAGQLGDGRAINLGEWEHKTSYTLQLKGAGPTAYSRRADGRAVLRSSVREYLVSEAMHHLGVPTTRALSLVSTGEDILRDMFYDGNPEYEPGAIVMRIAPSFLRFGNFEMLASRGEINNLRKLVEWTIKQHFPHLSGENRIIEWYEEIVEKTAYLMSEWHRVGFVHGVMNTDNMSILGQTIDYGPFSFLDDYDPDFTPNTTDLPGRRYAFGKQPSIGYWNLGRLANALVPLFEDTSKLEAVLETYEPAFWNKYYFMMSRKLGIDHIEKEDRLLISHFEKVLSALKPDMSIFYRLLINLPTNFQEEKILDHFQDCFYHDLTEAEKEEFLDLIREYSERFSKNSISREDSQEKMKAANPKFILRNYLLHQAIEKLEQGDRQLFDELQDAMKNPYADQHDEFCKKRPGWATKKAGCSMLSCSS